MPSFFKKITLEGAIVGLIIGLLIGALAFRI